VRRQPSPGRDIPAIALTAYARSEDRTRALRAGYQAHIAKPVEPNELLAMIASFVELTVARKR
jgi:CheY-like chemotaxis protein